MRRYENLRSRLMFFIKIMAFVLASFAFNGSGNTSWGANRSHPNQDTLTVCMKNVSVREVLSYIRETSGFIFLYRGADIDLDRKISMDARNRSLDFILNKIFKETDIEYFISGRQVIIRKKNKHQTIPVKEDDITISGTIKDKEGDRLIGVNISVEGEPNGTISDTQGAFSLQNIPKGAILAISFIGYQSKRVKAMPKLDVVLQEELELLEEVVVLGYGMQKKENLSGAVAVVPIRMLKNRPVANVGQALQGVVPNMNVTVYSGQATDVPHFNIRGTTSLNGGEPLIVMDGIVSGREQLNWMNPVDIHSISILKDASASAIYGSRAAFGVILVTTRKGVSEKMTVNYNSNFVARSVTRMPKIISDPYLVTTTVNIMSAPWSKEYTEEQLAYAKKRSEDPSLSPFLIRQDGSFETFGNTDWVNEAYKNVGFSTSHSFDFSGRNKNLGYFLSTNYKFQDGMVKYGTDKHHQYSFRSKIDLQVLDWWSISNNSNFLLFNYDSPTYLNSDYYWEINRLTPLAVARTPDGDWTPAGASVFGRLEEGGRRAKEQTMLSTQFSTKIDVLKDVFWIQGNFSYSATKYSEKGHTLPVAYYAGINTPERYYNEISSVYRNMSDSKHILLDVYGTFRKTFNERHAISTLLGFNQEEYKYENVIVGKSDLISDRIPSLNLASGEINLSESVSSWALRGGFARFTYGWDDKYMVEFNGRYDGTSRFPKNSRFIFSPSGSMAWVASKEKFWEPLKEVVNFFKLRGSYGRLGNQDVDPYGYMAIMPTGKMSYILDGKQPVYVSSPGLVSKNLTWEKVITSNIGLDVNLFKNKLTLTADVYIRRTKDMLSAGATLPGVLGTSMPRENVADLETKGWELTLGWKDQIKLAGKALNYSLDFNLADSRAYITKFSNKTGTLYDYYVGYEMGEIWGLTTDGFFTSQEDIDMHADQSIVTSYPGTRPLAPGDLKFRDLNGDDKIDWGKWTLSDTGDYRKIGNNRARYTFGFFAGADWANFDLSLFLQGVGKRDYYPGPSDLFFWGIYSQPWTNITQGNYYDRWTEETPNGYFPRFKSYVADGTEAALIQTRYLQNAAYIRLKNLTVGYTLPKMVTRKMGIDHIRLYFSGDNLAEWSGLYKYYRVDPEGLGGQMYPFQRSYSLGINVTF